MADDGELGDFLGEGGPFGLDELRYSIFGGRRTGISDEARCCCLALSMIVQSRQVLEPSPEVDERDQEETLTNLALFLQLEHA